MLVPLLQVEAIDKSYPGVHALDGVNFDLYEGEVHAIVGENGAGKSTLLKILSGAIPKDGGNIFIRGHKVNISGLQLARQLGIGMAFQELSLIPGLSVAENVFLGRWPRHKPFGTVDWPQLFFRAKDILGNLGVDIDPKERVSNLGMGERQLIEIAKILSLENAQILLFDEPTSALSDTERERLFGIIRAVKKKGIGIIYVSHRLAEVYQISDRVSVFRDGKKIGTLSVDQADEDTVIRMMVGRELKEKFPKIKIQQGKEILRIQDMTVNGRLHHLNLSLHQGEILGIFGLVGAGCTEFARALFGVDRIDSGEIFVDGAKVNISCPADAIKSGFGFLTENRQDGLLMRLAIPLNITLPNLRRFSQFGFLKINVERETAKKYVKELNIDTPKLDQRVELLSGGTQQKVALAKWLCSQSKILILDEPTRGIDVGAKVEVYRLINELAKQGAGVIMLSSELPEVLALADRILVMSGGSFVAEYEHGQATQEDLLKSAIVKLKKLN